ncbi:hypothetical protein ACTSKR_02250 [Chitinibacteraceae bacterium HSL-7]
MNITALNRRMRWYYVTTLFSVMFSLTAFVYSTWRMEVTERNNNVRTAAFEVLTELSELEQLVYAAHYDEDPVEGNPRRGWVKVTLIVELGRLISPEVAQQCEALRTVWKQNWPAMASEEAATVALSDAIGQTRDAVRVALEALY